MCDHIFWDDVSADPAGTHRHAHQPGSALAGRRLRNGEDLRTVISQSEVYDSAERFSPAIFERSAQFLFFGNFRRIMAAISRSDPLRYSDVQLASGHDRTQPARFGTKFPFENIGWSCQLAAVSRSDKMNFQFRS